MVVRSTFVQSSFTVPRQQFWFQTKPGSITFAIGAIQYLHNVPPYVSNKATSALEYTQHSLASIALAMLLVFTANLLRVVQQATGKRRELEMVVNNWNLQSIWLCTVKITIFSPSNKEFLLVIKRVAWEF